MADKALQSQQDSIRLPVYDLDAYRSSSGTDYSQEQAYINCWPSISKHSITGEFNVALIKRPGSAAISTLSPTIGSYGTRDDMVCLENKCISQLYDVYVAAFFDSGNSKIYILQYRPKSLTTTKIGEITTCTINDLVFVTEITNGDTLLPGIAVSYQKADRSSGTGYYAVTTAGVFTGTSLTSISSTSFPSNLGTPRIITGPFQHMNGHTYIMTLDGFVYMSSLTTAGNPDVTAWNTLATVTATQYPDRGMGVFRYKHHLTAFGQNSVEFFNDAGDPPPGSTLERTDQAFIKFGVYTPKAVVSIDDTLYWVGYSESNTFGVYRMDGYVPTKISTTKQDLALNAFFQGNTQAIGYFSLECLVLENKKHLIINGPTYDTWVRLASTITSQSSVDTYPATPTIESRTSNLAYSIDDKAWWGLEVGDPVTTGGNYSYIRSTGAFPATSQAGAYQQFCFFSLSSATGQDESSTTCPRTFNVSVQSASSYVDANPHGSVTSLPIPVTFQLNTYWFDTERRKRINKIKLIVDGLAQGVADANVYACYITYARNNELANTSAVPLARRLVIPQTNQRYYINNCSMARSLQVGVYCKSKDSFTVRGVELDLAQGTA